MAGLDPAISACADTSINGTIPMARAGGDGRIKSGHDVEGEFSLRSPLRLMSMGSVTRDLCIVGHRHSWDAS
jgi:hypothetical protein